MSRVTRKPVDFAPRPIPIDTLRGCEQRLDALCDLIDEELRTGAVGDRELSEYARRITGDVDQALAEETIWYGRDEFLN